MSRKPRVIDPEVIMAEMTPLSSTTYDPLKSMGEYPEFWSLNQRLPIRERLALILIAHLGIRHDMPLLMQVSPEEWDEIMAKLKADGWLRRLAWIRYIRGSGKPMNLMPDDVLANSIVRRAVA